MQVLANFIATAYLTFTCCIVNYILEQKKLRNKTKTVQIDRWLSALDSTIMSFSDQQLLTGISIIIAGLSQLEYGLLVYHFQAVGNLAWFSTMTHILTLTIVRRRVRSNTAIKTLRIILMGVLALMFICVMAPVGYITSFSRIDDIAGLPVEFPAWCLYHPKIDWRSDINTSGSIGYTIDDSWILHTASGYNSIYVAFTLGIIIYGYLTRVLLVLTDNVSKSIFHIPPGQPWKSLESILLGFQSLRAVTRKRYYHRILGSGHKLLYSFYVLLVVGVQLYTSKFWEVFTFASFFSITVVNEFSLLGCPWRLLGELYVFFLCVTMTLTVIRTMTTWYQKSLLKKTCGNLGRSLL